jgi:hypothetical protein
MCQIMSCQELSQNLESSRSEFIESAAEGIRLCQEDLVCDFTCAVVTVIFEIAMRL